MSAAKTEKREQARDLEAEQEIDLGRIWRSTLARWWLPVIGLVVGAIVGLLVAVGGGNEYKATAEVYLGQPLGPGQASPITSVSTVLGQSSYLITNEATIRQAAAKAGLTPAQLRRRVSSKPILGITGSKLGTAAPLLAITVSGSSRAKIAKGANALAQVVVDKLAPYPRQKLRSLQVQADRDRQRLTQTTQQLNAALAGQQTVYKDKSLSPTDKLVAIINFNGVINAASAAQNNLQLDLTQTEQQIASLLNIEMPAVVSPAVAANQGGPSRRSGVLIGAVIGFVIGLLVAILWDPVARTVRSNEAE
jgi:uncharacterized protein involved in exopolysaccharide biosynthesis